MRLFQKFWLVSIFSLLLFFTSFAAEDLDFPNPNSYIYQNLESAQWLYERREYLMAKSILERLEQKERLPRKVESEVILLLANIARETGDFPTAIVLYQKWKGKFPGSTKVPRVNFIMARTYRDMGIYNRAKEFFYLTLSSLVVVASRVSEEKEKFDKKLAKAAAWELAETEYQAKNWGRAYKLFERFKIQNPEAEKLIQTALYRQADCFYQLGKQGKTIDSYQTALAVAPFHPFAPEAWIRLVDLYGREGDFAQQAEALESFVWVVEKTQPEKTAYWQQRCASVLVEYIKERPEKAEEFLAAVQVGVPEADWSSSADFLQKMVSRMKAREGTFSQKVKGDESWAEWHRKISQGNQALNKSLEELSD